MQATHFKVFAKRPARHRAVVCRCETNGTSLKKVVVLGGTGRVGSATAASLLENFKQYDITVASRSQQSFEKIQELRPLLKNAKFAACDIGDKESVKVSGHSCLVSGWKWRS